MKIFKKIAVLFVFVSVVFACQTDKDTLYSLDYIPAPANVSAVFDITQDNTGLVSIVPNADGAQKFEIDFGDGTGSPAECRPGEIVKHNFAEGVYSVTITAYGITGLTTEFVQELNVSYKAPENLKVTVENDAVTSMLVNLSATADYATVFDVYWGDVTDEEATKAMPDETVSHQYEAAGTYNIRVVAKGAAIATLDTTFAFEVTAITAPVAAAPEPPVRGASDVISIFSDSYTNLEGTDFFPNWGQSTVVSTDVIAGDSTLKYSTFNYEGTQFANPIDASGMEYLHIDLWTADTSAVNVYCISPGPVEKGYKLSVTAGEWTSYDIPLSYFADVVDLTQLIQFKFDGGNGNTIFMDNIYFYKETASPLEAAPTPPGRAESDVISVFSDAYTNLAGTDFNPNWGQSTQVTTEDLFGNPTLKYATLNYQGTQFANPIDASSMQFVHIDMWTADASAVNFSLISSGPVETAYAMPITQGQWVSYDIPLSAFSDVVDLTDIIQFKFDGTEGATLFLDNMYFYSVASAPVAAAPEPPAMAASDVISVFSDAYTSLDGTDFNPNWGQSTVVTTEDIAGNPTLKYASFNYQGTQFANPIDATSMGYLHLDMWTADASSVNVYCISSGPNEKAYALPIVLGQWQSYDIPLSAFSDVVDLADLIQFKFDGTEGSTIYLDNIYFYKDNSASASLALPLDFESASLDYAFTDFDGGEVTIIDNPQPSGIDVSAKVAQMVKNAGQTWGGSYITLDNPIDFSAGKTFKMKVFSPRVGAKVLLKVENLTDSGISYEQEVSTTVANEWEELTFDYSGIDDTQSYQKIVLIFDNGTMGDGSADFTFLFDDIALTN